MSEEPDNSPSIIANFILNDMKGILNKRKIAIEDCPVKPEVIGCLGRLVAKGLLSKASMKKLVTKWIEEAP